MKKMKNFALMGAIALTSAVGFTACSSSDDMTVNNPDYNPETNSVKTQFTISLPSGLNQTRQVSAVTQETGFRGIEKIKLIPYTLASGDVLVGSTANASLTELAAISAFDNANSNSKVYADVEFNTGTSNFLFYGKAVDNTANTDIVSASDKFNFGTLAVTGLTGTPTLSSVEFSPVAIYENGTTEEMTAINAGKAVGTSLIAALNAVANATPASALSDNNTPKFKEVTAAQNSTVNDLFTLYSALTTASSHSVQAIFFRLYSALDVLAASDNTSDGYKLATAIRTAIGTYCDITASGGATTAVTLKSEYRNYPASVNLPDGAVRVVYTGNQFVAASSMAYATTYNVTALDHYVFPANLQYYVNSPIKVANAVKSPQYLTNSWADILNLYTDGTAITGNTRSVALINPVQYGVGRLDASIAQLANATFYDYDGNEVNVTAGYTLKGILIGGQKSVGWNYAVKGTSAYTIYDKTLEPTSATVNWTVSKSAGTATNHTLVLETEPGDEVGTVNIALEFVNNGADFAGAGGQIIPAGGTFYIVGQLKPSEGTGYSATTTGKDRVFTQDYKTIATFTINAGSNNSTDPNYRKGLGSATNGLPDLRSSKLELGLSVNLEWQAGLTFNVGI